VNWNNQTIRELERGSIRAFMEKHQAYLSGRVLDFGSGSEPYRDLVSGEYVPFDTYEHKIMPVGGKRGTPQGAEFDAIMCNQVIQYIPDPQGVLIKFYALLKRGGHLVITFPTNWDEVEPTDFWRFTRKGMERLLSIAGFSPLIVERRAEIALGGFRFPLGYGVVAERQ
jgi:SAM-dependent methyltransferase